MTCERLTAGPRGLGTGPAGPQQEFTRRHAPPPDHPVTLLELTFHGLWRLQLHCIEVETTFFQGGQTWAQIPAEFFMPSWAALFKSEKLLELPASAHPDCYFQQHCGHSSSPNISSPPPARPPKAYGPAGSLLLSGANKF